jgi:hypothetical protein
MSPRRTEQHRQSWQEALELVKLPPRDSSDDVFRYMGTRAGWIAHRDLVEFAGVLQLGDHPRTNANAAHGGHAYCQAGLAACRAMAEIEKREGVGEGEKLDLHVRFCPSPAEQRALVVERVRLLSQGLIAPTDHPWLLQRPRLGRPRLHTGGPNRRPVSSLHHLSSPRSAANNSESRRRSLPNRRCEPASCSCLPLGIRLVQAP